MFIKRDDYALFGADGYIPTLSEEVLELIIKYPHDYEVKAFNVEGLKLNIFNSYRLLVQQNALNKLTNLSFVETIKPFLNFYRSLPEYSIRTKRLSLEALKIREVIANSHDPESTFFESFPLALNYSLEKLKNSDSDLQEYVDSLQNAVRELRTCYEVLLNRVELFLQNEIVGKEIPFDSYKLVLQKRYKGIKKHLLLPKQKSFIQRIYSQLDDRNVWLNSIAQATIGKTLDKISDEEELIFYDRFKSLIIELDSLTYLSNSGYSEEDEDVVSLEISAFFSQVSKKLIRVPKNKKAEIQQTEESIRNMLSSDRTLNIMALTRLLKEIIEE